MNTVADLQLVAQAACASTLLANAEDSLPIIRNPNAVKYGYAVKLVPVFFNGVLVAREEHHINSKVTEVQRSSPLGFDPIMRDMEKRARRDHRPIWTGD